MPIYWMIQNNIHIYNRIHHIGQGVLNDLAGIYTLSKSEGTDVNNNVIHDAYCYSYGGWGLYTDQASSNIIFENNLIYNTSDGGYEHHFGRDNIIRNNIFAFAKEGQLRLSKAEEHPEKKHMSFTFKNNIVYFR